jgi:hypothetical protein
MGRSFTQSFAEGVEGIVNCSGTGFEGAKSFALAIGNSRLVVAYNPTFATTEEWD